MLTKIIQYIYKSTKNNLLDTFISLHKLNRYRYLHTLELVNGLMLIKSANYSEFERYADNVNDDHLAEKSFIAAKKITSSFIRKYEKEIIITCLVHDYGHLRGEPNNHDYFSGIYCKDDLRQIGLDDNWINFISLTVANHLLISRIVSGEGGKSLPINYLNALSPICKNMKMTIEEGYMFLWLLTLLDIRASGTGFLTETKYQSLKDVNTIKKLLKTINSERFIDYKLKSLNAGINKKLLKYPFEVISVELYFVVNSKSENKISPLIRYKIVEKFLDMLYQLWAAESDNELRYISFSSYEIENKPDLLHETQEELASRIHAYSMDNAVNNKEKKFLGYAYSVENGCLLINNYVPKLL